MILRVVLPVTLFIGLVVLLVRFDVLESGMQGRTLWEWMDVFGVPVVVAVVVGGFTIFVQGVSRRLEVDRELANDHSREAASRAYLALMSDLTLDKGLLNPDAGVQLRAVAYAQTLAVLRGLDGTRKGVLIRFLSEMNVPKGPTVSLSTADLSGAELTGAVLSGALLDSANLTEANLFESDLSGANLLGANLAMADLSEADLSGANLGRANMSGGILNSATLSDTNMELADLQNADLREALLVGARLVKADLRRANLSGADLRGADLGESDLRGAKLAGADLRGAKLTRADLGGSSWIGLVLTRVTPGRFDLNHSDADLRDVDLSGADLSMARVKDWQLRQATDLAGATMPDGSTMTFERWMSWR